MYLATETPTVRKEYIMDGSTWMIFTSLASLILIIGIVSSNKPTKKKSKKKTKTKKRK